MGPTTCTGNKRKMNNGLSQSNDKGSRNDADGNDSTQDSKVVRTKTKCFNDDDEVRWRQMIATFYRLCLNSPPEKVARTNNKQEEGQNNSRFQGWYGDKDGNHGVIEHIIKCLELNPKEDKQKVRQVLMDVRDWASRGLVYYGQPWRGRQRSSTSKKVVDSTLEFRSGPVERNSLIHLCNRGGDDNLFVSALLDFLTVEDIGRCEIVCRYWKRLVIEPCWTKLDKDMIMSDVAGISSSSSSRVSPSAKTARERVIRYHLASSLAKQIGDMGESINKHLIVQNVNRYERTFTDERIYGGCNEKGCDFPTKLNFNIFRSQEAAKRYEIYVRFSKTSDNTSLAEGFVPFIASCNVEIDLQDMDFSNWPQLLEFTQLVSNSKQPHDDDDDRGGNVGGDGDGDGEEEVENCTEKEEILKECVADLTVTVIGVNKTNNKASLILAQSNLGETHPGTNNGGVEYLGGHGYCWPKGRMSVKSHGPIQLKSDFISGAHWTDHAGSEAKLGMFFDTKIWTDPKDSNKVIHQECYWNLLIEYDLQDQE